MSDNAADAPSVIYPIVANAAMVNESQVQDFMGTLFSRVLWKKHHFVNLRGIGEKGTSKEGAFHADEWIQPGLEEFPDEHVADLTIHHVKRWSQYHIAAFVVPAVLKAAQGRSENVDLQVAVVVDLDTGDTRAKAAWIDEHIGTPTMVVLSGGTTDAGTPKMHLYWVLDDPEENVAAVVEARHLLAEKIGGDLQFGRGTPDNPLGRAHQPIRIAGSVHAKHGREAPVQLVWASGPTPEFGWLLWKIRNAPRSPWFVEARAAPASTGFDFGPTKNQRPDLDSALVEDIHEGGEGEDSRYGRISKVIGGLIGTARRNPHLSLEEAKSQSYAWMQVHMKPPYTDAAFDRHWHRLLEIDERKNGAIVAVRTVEEAKPLVAEAELGLREWAAHRWANGEPKPRDFLVEGLVLAKKPHLVVAEGGAGKTFSMLDLGLKVAAWEEGDDLRWWGQPVRRGGTVVMLTTEDDADELHIRIHDIDPDGLRFKAGDRWIVAPLANMGGAFTLGERDRHTGNVVPAAKWMQTLDLLRGLPDVALVIVDTLNTTLHGEENSATVVGEYAKLLQPVCGEIGAALVVTHHIRKTDPNNPIHSPDEMAAAVRGSSALPAAFRAVLGMWHCHDYAKRMKAMELEPKPKQLWRMGVLKANNPEMVDGVRFLLRQDSGVLEDATSRVVNAQRSAGAQQAAWLVLAVRLAAEAGYPYTTGSRNDNGGLYARRAELPAALKAVAWRALDTLRDQVIGNGEIVVACARGAKARKLLDVPGGAFAASGRGEDVKPGAMTPVEWGDWEWSDVEAMPVPVGTPKLTLTGGFGASFSI